MLPNRTHHIIAIKIILGVYLVFSLGYIGYDLWSDFKVNQMTKAYSAGQADAVNQLLTASEKCEPIPIFSGEKKVELISTACTQK